MINNNDKLISDISYTNKDFNSIYSELLDTAKTLTNKWDPSLSNESDPGVLLLKLNAIVADKNNYNIDKNVLECFPLSVTQQGNARKLYDLVGYTMHWYQSATTNLNYTLITDKDKLDTLKGKTITINLFDMVTNKDGSVTFTNLRAQNVNIPSTTDVTSKLTYSLPAIEGTIHDFEVNGDTNLTLDNLDDDLRLYFPETRIAENGIYISTSNTWSQIDEWKRVDNLASYPQNNKIYKFGVLPNSNTCYIQFPRDVVNLITGTFQVKYIISNGLEGNTKSLTITKFLNDRNLLNSSDSSIMLNDTIKVSQSEDALGGKDIESLDDAYNNYKKSVGTFNTLVTNQDYESYIYNTDLVSNLRVSDRTNDLNYTNYIQTWEPGSTGSKKLIISKDSNNNLKMLPFTVYLYPLKKINPTSNENYNAGFEYDVSQEQAIKDSIDEVKSIQHDIKTIDGETSYKIFNNLYTLTGEVTTYYKVTKEESKEIESNIQKSLINKYYSRNINYGEKPDFDELILTIKNADNRINNVLLNNPQYSIKNSGKKLENSDKINLIARMCLSGNVQLFKFNDDFLFDFNQLNGKYNYGEIKTITTEANIPFEYTSGGSIYLKPNESIQFLTINYIITTTYGKGVTYSLYNSAETIYPNSNHILKSELTLKWVDSNGLSQEKKLPSGTVIYSNIEINGGEGEKTLQYGETISIKEKNEKTLNQGIKYIAILNNNSLSLESKGSYILQENEYLIYTDEAVTGIATVGTGTQITNDSDNEITLISNKISNINDVNKDLWVSLSSTQKLTLTEMEIYTATSEDTINKKYGEINSPSILNNNIQPFKYVMREGENDILTISHIDGTEDTLIDVPAGWFVRSRLNLNTSQDNIQYLLDGQKIYFNNNINPDIEGKSAETQPYIKGENTPYLLFNTPLSITGGVNLNMSSVDSSGNIIYPLRAYSFNVAYKEVSDESGGKYKKLDTTWDRDEKDLLTISGKDIGTGLDIPFKFKINTHYLINFEVVSPNGKITLNNKAYGNGIYCLDYTPTSDTTLKITKDINFKDGDSIIFDYINIVEGYNSDEINVSKAYSADDDFDLNGTDTTTQGTNGKAIENQINTILENSLLYDGTPLPTWNKAYRVPDKDKVLQPTLSTSYFNKNHIYNRYTIPQINTNSYNIKVNPYYLSGD